MDNRYEERVQQEREKFKNREEDFRNGAIVYQILVDRFAPSQNLSVKKELYAHPKRLMKWEDVPLPGPFNKTEKYWQHELDYWGGDLQSVLSKIDYLKDLGVTVVYLNPIMDSVSNHKYDATDYMKISPEFGTVEDFKTLCDTFHQHNIKVVLDGVFNHVGINNTIFQEAQNPQSEKHDWFDFNESYPKGVRLWADVPSLPEWNLENENVRDYIYRSKDSVVRTYQQYGIDGWRLDVAFDIGYEYLRELTNYVHKEKPGSLVVGEIWNYPKDWLQSIDGVMNFTFRDLIKRSITGAISPQQTSIYLNQIITDAGIEGILKSWNLLDNHDTARLTHQLPQKMDQQLAQVFQFTLPGSPNIYYGTELGMDGAEEPASRAPMRWDLVQETNETYQWTKTLIHLHRQERALRIGDYIQIYAQHLVAFERKTDKVFETVLVFINTTEKEVTEELLIPDSSLMNLSKPDVILGNGRVLHFLAGFMTVSIPSKSFLIVKPHTIADKSYTPYKRV